MDQARQTSPSGVHAQTDGARPAPAPLQGLPGPGTVLLARSLSRVTRFVSQVSRSLISALCPQIVEEEALIKNNNTCKDFLIEALKYHLLPADQRHLIKTDRTRPRTPISIPKVPARSPEHVFVRSRSACVFLTVDCAGVQVMIVVGGQAPKAIRSVECYDFQEDRWYQVADLPSRRCRAGRPPLKPPHL